MDKPVEDFHKKKSTKDGLQNKCKECSRKAMRKYYEKNIEEHKLIARERNNKIKNANRMWLAEYLMTHHCVDCGNSDIRVLEFDHVSGKKIKGVARLISNGYSIKSIIKEIEKCEVRCRNCHQIKTFERMGGSWHDKYLGL